MKARAEISAGSYARSRELLGYVLVAATVWLAWEVVKAPVVQRGTVALAVRLAPQSGEVLQRAAERELLADRPASAKALAEAALLQAPFNARALRVRGLSEARLGSAVVADEILTLAGNWSLRDDPAHAWLVENRLRKGDYASAFAHADTLARRRPDLYPNLFALFAVAARTDPRALQHLTRILGAAPPWRAEYFEYLYRRPDGAPTLGAIAIALENTPHPLTTAELQKLYSNWTAERRFQGLRNLRAILGRPPLSEPVQNGDFSIKLDAQAFPFGWQLGGSPGLGALVSEDDLRTENSALRVDYDGFGGGVFAEQLLLLPPGRYDFSGEQRLEAAADGARMAWRLRCAESGSTLLDHRVASVASDANGWRRFSQPFQVPETDCTAQWLNLEPLPEDRKVMIAVWFDALRVSRASTSDTP